MISRERSDQMTESNSVDEYRIILLSTHPRDCAEIASMGGGGGYGRDVCHVGEFSDDLLVISDQG
jgi:hypothetical protein